MNRYLKFSCLVIVALWSHLGLSQFNPADNRLDKKGLRQGEWVVMLDSLFQETNDTVQAKLYRKISYKNNTPIGVTTEYYLSGLPYWKGKIISENPLVYDSTVEHYYPNGQVQYRYTYKDNRVHGKAYEYYEFGELKTISNYVDGKLDGPYEQYHINGNTIFTATYRYGQLDGAYAEYHSNGILSFAGLMDDNRKEGEWTVWDNTGKAIKTETYVYNELMPTKEQMAIPQNPNKRNGIGTRLGTFTYMFDEHWDFTQNPVEAKYYRIVTYKDDKPVGLVTDYYVSGNKQWEGKILSDIPDVIHGKSITYYESGEVKKVEKYKKGKRHGKRTYFYENGKVEETDVYKNGELNGPSILYYPNGIVKQKVTHVNGKQHGEVILNYKNGQPRSRGEMDMGVKTGKWTWFLEDGTEKSSYEFKDGQPVLTKKPITLAEKHIQTRDRYTESGQIDSALFFGNKAYLQSKKDKGSTDRQTIACAFALGKLYFRLNKISTADSIFEEVSSTEKISGYEKTYAHINTLRLLASTKKLLNDLDATEKLLLKQEKLIKSINDEASKPLAALYQDIGRHYESIGETNKANEYFESSFATYQELGLTTGVEYSNLLEEVGRSYLDKNDPELALYFFHEALTNYLKFFPNESEFNTQLLDDIGRTHEQLNNLEIAKRYYEESMLVRKNLFGERHWKTSFSYLALANIHSKLSLNTRAESLFLTTLGIQQKTFGKNSREYLETNNLLGQHYSRIGEISKAKMILENNLSIYRVLKDDVGLAETHLQLAKIYHDHFQFEDAENNYLLASNHYKKLKGSEINLIDLHTQLGSLYSDFGKYKDCEFHFNFSLELTTNMYGTKSLKSASLYFEIGKSFFNQRLFQKSLVNLYLAKEILSTKLVDDDVLFSEVLMTIGDIDLIFKDTASATGNYQMAYKIITSLSNKYDLDQAMGHFKYGKYLQAIGKQDEALKNFQLSQHKFISNYKTQDVNYARVLYQKSLALISLDKHIDALQDLIDASSLFKENLADHDIEYLQCLKTIADVYLKLNSFGDAERFLKMRYDIAKNNLVTGNQLRGECIKDLASFYQIKKDDTKAANLFVEVLKNDLSFIRNEFLIHDTTTKIEFFKNYTNNIFHLENLNQSIKNSKIKAFIATNQNNQSQLDTIKNITINDLEKRFTNEELKATFTEWYNIVMRTINLQNDKSVHYEEIEYLRMKLVVLKKELGSIEKIFLIP